MPDFPVFFVNCAEGEEDLEEELGRIHLAIDDGRSYNTVTKNQKGIYFLLFQEFHS